MKPQIDFFDDCEITEQPDRPKARKRETLKKVTVLDPFSVSHNGTAYFPGEVAEVPASVAEFWAENKWVTE